MKTMVMVVMVSALALGGTAFAADRDEAVLQKVVLGSTADELIPSDLGQHGGPRAGDRTGESEDAYASVEDEEQRRQEMASVAQEPAFVPFSDSEEKYQEQLG